MIAEIIEMTTRAVVNALKAFFLTFREAVAPEVSPEVSPEPTPSDTEGIAFKLAEVLNLQVGDSERLTTPFSKHMGKYFDKSDEQTMTDIVENMLLSLESIGNEILTIIDGKITTSIDRRDMGSYTLVDGHLGLDVDTVDPDVYTISMELLRDGFTFRADSRTFVITSKVPK